MSRVKLHFVTRYVPPASFAPDTAISAFRSALTRLVEHLDPRRLYLPEHLLAKIQVERIAHQFPRLGRQRDRDINRSNLLVLESKADMQKRGQASPDDGDALAADLRAARGGGGNRRRGRRGSIRPVHWQQQLGVDAMTSHGGCTVGGGRKTPGQLSPSAPARSGEWEAFTPESSSFPIFLRATMAQVESPDTGEGLGCGRFRVYLARHCAGARKQGRYAEARPGLARTTATRWR
jgi:hypothetical protein